MSGRLLFAKVSLKSFIYDLTEIFCFLQKEIQDISKKCLIEKEQIFHILRDTDSTALPEEKFRDVIFEVKVTTKIYKRFDTSHKF